MDLRNGPRWAREVIGRRFRDPLSNHSAKVFEERVTAVYQQWVRNRNKDAALKEEAFGVLKTVNSARKEAGKEKSASSRRKAMEAIAKRREKTTITFGGDAAAPEV